MPKIIQEIEDGKYCEECSFLGWSGCVLDTDSLIPHCNKFIEELKKEKSENLIRVFRCEQCLEKFGGTEGK